MTASRTVTATADEMTVERTAPDGRRMRYVMRQVGWWGQSGAFYGLADPPYGREPGSFSPAWVIGHADELDDEGNPL
ncbi:hypothetical protein JOL79_06845 [Microbispora sp. RL4-1S]|uniref:Uncharacterized protein n=1 Tax=Microbispora oryzae TaxID=2806554 RepID=A0A940WL74_9ACTN|nr:hypothetical protein [Microbispora oryzae]MBP2703515.1 hypothetical protein [Microbispora oryzae]